MYLKIRILLFEDKNIGQKRHNIQISSYVTEIFLLFHGRSAAKKMLFFSAVTGGAIVHNKVNYLILLMDTRKAVPSVPGTNLHF